MILGFGGLKLIVTNVTGSEHQMGFLIRRVEDYILKHTLLNFIVFLSLLFVSKAQKNVFMVKGKVVLTFPMVIP